MIKYNINKKIIKNPLRFINKITISNIDYNSVFDNFKCIDSLECLMKILNENKCLYIELISLNNEEVDYILNLVSDYIEYIDLFDIESNLLILNECKKIKEVKINNSKIKKLWDLKENKDLTNLTIIGCNELNDIEGIKDSSLLNLKIKKDYQIIPERLDLRIKDFSIFKTLNNLKKLSLFIMDNENKKDDLINLSELKNLEKLHLPKDYFTFEEFAFLKSKLINTKNIDAIYHIAKDPSNEEVYYIVIGKDKPDFIYLKDEDYNIYSKEYNELIKKYKE